MSEPLQTKYGLPREVFYCQRCVMSNQRPTSSIEFKPESERSRARLVA